MKQHEEKPLVKITTLRENISVYTTIIPVLEYVISKTYWKDTSWIQTSLSWWGYQKIEYQSTLDVVALENIVAKRFNWIYEKTGIGEGDLENNFNNLENRKHWCVRVRWDGDMITCVRVRWGEGMIIDKFRLDHNQMKVYIFIMSGWKYILSTCLRWSCAHNL